MIPHHSRGRNWIQHWGLGDCYEQMILYEKVVSFTWGDGRREEESLLMHLGVLQMHGMRKVAEELGWRVVRELGTRTTQESWGVLPLLDIRFEGLVVRARWGAFRPWLVQRVLSLEGYLTCSREDEWRRQNETR